MSARTRAGGGAGRGARSDERGLTMIELVVAVSVFAILAGGLALDDRGRAQPGPQQPQPQRRREPGEPGDGRHPPGDFTTLPLGLVDRPQSVDGVPYTVRRESEWVDNDSTKGPCDAGSSTPQVLRVTVSVFWSDIRGVPPVTSSTILSPPVGSYDPNNGHIAVKVLGGTASPLVGVPVTVTASGFNRNLTTTSDGCAFFAFVPPASYTVSLGAVGYVDRQGNLGPSQVTGVTSGAVSSVAFDYDQAATLTLTLGSTGGGSIPVEPVRRRREHGAAPDGVEGVHRRGRDPDDRQPVPVPGRLRRLGRELRRRRPRGQGRQRPRVLARRDP